MTADVGGNQFKFGVLVQLVYVGNENALVFTHLPCCTFQSSVNM